MSRLNVGKKERKKTVLEVRGEFEHSFYLYCLHEVSEHKYVLLNRKYKPLGVSSGDHVDYEPFSINLTITEEDAKLFEKDGICIRGIFGRVFYLHDDDSSPWYIRPKAEREEYLRRCRIITDFILKQTQPERQEKK